MRVKPHIRKSRGMWITSIAGEDIFEDAEMDQAFVSARILWRHQ